MVMRAMTSREHDSFISNSAGDAI